MQTVASAQFPSATDFLPSACVGVCMYVCAWIIQHAGEVGVCSLFSVHFATRVGGRKMRPQLRGHAMCSPVGVYVVASEPFLHARGYRSAQSAHAVL